MSQLIKFDPAGSYLSGTGIDARDVAGIGSQLEKLRDEMCELDPKILAGQIPAPEAKQPLDAGFYLLPERLLAEYEADRQGSELARLLAFTKQLMSEVDRVVVLGAGGAYLGAQALLHSCCQPYFNELSRGARGSRPRIYFAGNSFDNDASQGLLHFLGAHKGTVASNVEDAWGIVVISESGAVPETTIALRQFLAALETNCGGDVDTLRRRLIPVSGDSGKLRDLAIDLGCKDIFPIPAGVSERFSVLSAVGLVPAALMGINIMKLLEGARAMNEHFRTTKAAENIVLHYTAVNHLLECKRGATVRVLNVWSKALESAGLWYEHVLSESLGKRELGATVLTTVSSRDLYSRYQQFHAGRQDKIINNVLVEDCRFDPLTVGYRDRDLDGLNAIKDQTLPQALKFAVTEANEALRKAGRPTTNIILPRTDEFFMGQFFQMLMLATVVEGRMLGINPYGQANADAFRASVNCRLGR